MNIRPILAAVASVMFVYLLGSDQGARAQTYRALLVGINTYVPADMSDAEREVVDERGIHNLRGPLNDVAWMSGILRARWSFTDVECLTERDATRANILAQLNSAVDAAKPGDVFLFYYSGHGSTAPNSLSTEPGHLDQTIVPADAIDDVPDIHDKELAHIFNRAVTKGIHVTAIFDCCYSGGLSRGPYSDQSGDRSVLPDIHTAAVGSDACGPPEARGALFFAACQDDEEAQETPEQSRYDGVFTRAVATEMQTLDVDEPASEVLQRVVSHIQGDAMSQIPNLEGTSGRRKQPLFGTVSNAQAGQTIVAVSALGADGTVTLDGGLAAALRSGCELTQIQSAKDNKPIRLRLTEVDDR
jgi:hypothetical protein